MDSQWNLTEELAFEDEGFKIDHEGFKGHGRTTRTCASSVVKGGSMGT